MKEITRQLKEAVYPAIQNRAQEVFPEFEFKDEGDKYISTNNIKITGETGNKTGGVYSYKNNPGFLIDYTRGDWTIWDYIAEREGLTTNKQVIERLFELGGIPLPKRFSDEELNQLQWKNREKNVYQTMQDFFYRSLQGASEDSHIKQYIKERGLERLDEQEKEYLGYIPFRKALREYLEKYYSPEEIDEFLKLQTCIGETHTLTIPYRDISGGIIGFIFRDITETQDPKYLYSKGLQVSENLFNIHNYKRKDPVMLVEGILDALRAEAEGVRNVIALGSNNLNTKQAEQLIRLAPKDITLALDNDSAGIEGTHRAIDILLEKNPHAKIYVGKYPKDTEAKDVDSLITEKGVEYIRNIPKWPFYTYQGEQILRKHLLKKAGDPTQEDYINFKEDILEVAQKVSDPTELDLLAQHVEFWTDGNITRMSFQEEGERRREERRREKQNRELNALIADLQKDSREGNTQKAIQKLSEQTERIKEEEKSDKYTNLLIPLTEQDIKDTLQTRPDSISSGFKFHDGGKNIELSIPSGALTVIGARTSHGKTAFLMNMLLNMERNLEDQTLHFFTYEESTDAIITKLLNVYLDTNLQQGTDNREYIESYFRKNGEGFQNPDFLNGKDIFLKHLIESGKIKVHFFSSYSVSELTDAIEYISDQDNAGAIFIDYLQRIPSNGKYDTRQLELQAITGRLLDVAGKTGLPVITASQFNRQVNKQEDVSLANLREAGDIEQDANLILGLWNHQKDKDNAPKGQENKIEVNVLKNRDGKADMEAFLEFNGKTGKIKNTDS